VGEVDLMRDAFFGFEVLAGGIDGRSVTRPSHTTSATVSLVLENLAARAAEHVVRADFAEPDRKKRRLLSAIDAGDTSEEAVRAQLAALQLDLFGQTLAADHPHVLEAHNLFAAALTGSSAERAWQLTLYALLQDPRLLHY
jgi:hypothetical protein